jgi:hypothetical protein
VKGNEKLPVLQGEASEGARDNNFSRLQIEAAVSYLINRNSGLNHD